MSEDSKNYLLTEEEVNTLQAMQKSLKTEFDAFSHQCGGDSYHEAMQLRGLRASTAAAGYAAVTDLLSRNRPGGSAGR